MKYVFGINITKNKENNLIDGEIFRSKTATSELMEELKKCESLAKNYEKHTSLPFWMDIMKYLSFSITCFCLCSVMQDISDLSWKEVYKNPSGFFFAAVAFFIVWLVLYLLERMKKHLHKVEYERGKDYIQNVTAHAKDLMEIPDDAVKMEILSFYYKIEKEKMKVMTASKLVCITHNNVPVYMYVKDVVLHITDFYQEWSIPLYAITGIKKMNETIFISEWKKEIPYHKGEFKKYKIARANGLGYLYMKPYYALCITWYDENYELFLPPYELDVLSSLVGIHYDEMYSK